MHIISLSNRKRTDSFGNLKKNKHLNLTFLRIFNVICNNFKGRHLTVAQVYRAGLHLQVCINLAAPRSSDSEVYTHPGKN